MNKESAVQKSKRDISIDEGVLTIDRLLSGWTSFIDMDLLLHNLHRSRLEIADSLTSEEEVFMEVNPSVLSKEEYKLKVMERYGYLYTNRVKQYFYHMSEIWTQVHHGVADKKKIGLIIEQATINRKNCNNFSLSDSTLTYLYKGRGVKTLKVFKYIDTGYSIAADLSFYNENLGKRQATNKRNQAIADVGYDIHEAYKYNLTSPDPDIINRKVRAAEIQRLHDVLVKETTKQIQQRLLDVSRLGEERPSGWVAYATDTYLKAIYDGTGIVDSGFLEPIIQRFCDHLSEHLKVDGLPTKNVNTIIDYLNRQQEDWDNSEYSQKVAYLANSLVQEDLSKEAIRKLSGICVDILHLKPHADQPAVNAHVQEKESIEKEIRQLRYSAKYVFLLLQVQELLLKTRLGSATDVNSLIDASYKVYELLSILRFNVELVEHHRANEAFLQECDALVSVLDVSIPFQRFLAGLAVLMRSYISRSVVHNPDDYFTPQSLKVGLDGVDSRTTLLFYKMLHPMRFNYNRKTLHDFIQKDISSSCVRTTLVQFIRNFLCSVLKKDMMLLWNKESVIEVFKDLERTFSSHEEFSYDSPQLIILKYTIIALTEKPFPLGRNASISPNVCEKVVNGIIRDAAERDMTDDEMQLLLILLSIICLNNYNIPYMEQGEHVASEFASVTERLVYRIAPCKEKYVLLQAVNSLSVWGFSGFFH